MEKCVWVLVEHEFIIGGVITNSFFLLNNPDFINIIISDDIASEESPKLAVRLQLLLFLNKSIATVLFTWSSLIISNDNVYPKLNEEGAGFRIAGKG